MYVCTFSWLISYAMITYTCIALFALQAWDQTHVQKWLVLMRIEWPWESHSWYPCQCVSKLRYFIYAWPLLQTWRWGSFTSQNFSSRVQFHIMHKPRFGEHMAWCSMWFYVTYEADQPIFKLEVGTTCGWVIVRFPCEGWPKAKWFYDRSAPPGSWAAHNLRRTQGQ